MHLFTRRYSVRIVHHALLGIIFRLHIRVLRIQLNVQPRSARRGYYTAFTGGLWVDTAMYSLSDCPRKLNIKCGLSNGFLFQYILQWHKVLVLNSLLIPTSFLLWDSDFRVTCWLGRDDGHKSWLHDTVYSCNCERIRPDCDTNDPSCGSLFICQVIGIHTNPGPRCFYLGDSALASQGG